MKTNITQSVVDNLKEMGVNNLNTHTIINDKLDHIYQMVSSTHFNSIAFLHKNKCDDFSILADSLTLLVKQIEVVKNELNLINAQDHHIISKTIQQMELINED